jgi:hypothetical protein
MDINKIKTIKAFESEIYSETDISKKLSAGWILLEIRKVHAAPYGDGSFREELIYTLGHESENP